MSSTGKGQYRLTVGGACFLGETALELAAIQRFEEQVKRNPAFFKGFTVAQVDQISAAEVSGPQAKYTYRTFQFNCNSERRL